MSAKTTNTQVMNSVEQLAQAVAAMAQMQAASMQQVQALAAAQQPAPQRTFGGTVITAQQAAEIDAHNEQVRIAAEAINDRLREKVIADGLVDSAQEHLESMGLDYEGIASFASNACYNARRSAYSIRAGVERAEEYQARVSRAPINNPALAQAITAQTESQQRDIMMRLEKAETQKIVYFTYNQLLINMLTHHLVPIVDQNERQGMASLEGDTDKTFVSMATVEFLSNTPVLSEADYRLWREDDEKRRDTRRKQEVAAVRHTSTAMAATFSSRV